MFVGELEFGDLPIETTVGYLFLLGKKSIINKNATQTRAEFKVSMAFILTFLGPFFLVEP